MSQENNTQIPVVFEELSGSGQKRIGLATLNAEKSLNALTLEMVELMLNQFQQWKDDRNIAAVYINGAGQKAFCAGGDVQALYRSATQSPGGPCEYAETFFEKEYRLDYLIHSFPKPVVCWGSGIVMGGGLGVFAASSHRIVTESTRLAMPEITIGLYPDVGGSWFLNKMPGNTGMFLALTGAPINSADSLFVGIADYFANSQSQDELLDKLCSLLWTGDADKDHALLSECLIDFSAQHQQGIPDSNVERNKAIINTACDAQDIYRIVESISQLDSEDKWLSRAKKTLLAGSPLSTLIIHKQLVNTRGLSLSDVFCSELILSTNIVRHTEFSEGVRALLIDKDNSPQWQYKKVQDVPPADVEQFFIAPNSPAPWPANPLKNL